MEFFNFVITAKLLFFNNGYTDVNVLNYIQFKKQLTLNVKLFRFVMKLLIYLNFIYIHYNVPINLSVLHI